MDKPKEVRELEELCRPLVDYLKENCNPHCEVIISEENIRLISTEIGIPI